MNILSRIVFILALVAITIPAVAQDDAEALTPSEICSAYTEIEEPENRTFEQPEEVLEEGVDYRAVFCTGVGAIYIDLLEAHTPLTVNSFLFLVENGYYNNTTFHRVIEDFMAQGGDPTATGGGHPGYQFTDEFVSYLSFSRPGWLAMANSGPSTNGSQFFITTAPTPHLNNRHTIFGEVLEGQDVVEAIELRDPQTATEPGTSLDTIVIITEPELVNTTYEVPPPFTQDDVAEPLSFLLNDLPEGLEADELNGSIDLETLVETFPDDLQESYEEFLDTYGFEFSEALSVVNEACTEAIPFTNLSYRVDAFEDTAAAEQAFEDPLIGEVMELEGFEVNEPTDFVDVPYYTKAAPSCADQQGTQVVGYYVRSKYIIRAEILVDDAFLEEVAATPDIVFSSLLVQQFDGVMAELYSPPLR